MQNYVHVWLLLSKREAQQEAKEVMSKSMGFEKTENKYILPHERTDR